MASFTEIMPQEMTDNVFKLIGEDWALVTAGTEECFNTMTVSWGGAGILWNKPVAFTFIRPQRYTFGFTERGDCFSMSFFDEEHRAALRYCGSKSGRDVDKVKETGLTPAFSAEGIPYFEEARLVLLCKKLYAQDLAEACIRDDMVKQFYQDDYHKMYVSKILRVLKKA
ncbi:MAG: flavin reductase [Ruminococcus sp.]|nr:flavin reductase [Ruminococcus sp.]